MLFFLVKHKIGKYSYKKFMNFPNSIQRIKVNLFILGFIQKAVLESLSKVIEKYSKHIEYKMDL